MTLSKPFVMAACALGALLAAGPAAAQFKDAHEAVEYRHGAFHIMGTHFSRLGAMVNGKVPFDAKAAAANAEMVAQMASLPWAAFTPGSDKDEENTAKPEVWSQPDKFKAAAQKMQDAVVTLNAAAKTGDFDKLKAAFGATGQTCKGCHDDFRKKR